VDHEGDGIFLAGDEINGFENPGLDFVAESTGEMKFGRFGDLGGG